MYKQQKYSTFKYHRLMVSISLSLQWLLHGQTSGHMFFGFNAKLLTRFLSLENVFVSL